MAETRSSKEKRRMEKFTEDLVAEILVNLPVKSLLRFKCVCRSWFDLIKSPNFVRLHLNHHKGNGNILMLTREGSRSVISSRSYESLGVILPNLNIPHPHIHRYEGFCGPCDGLICFSNMDGDFPMLCNPSMREFKLLPPFAFASGCYTEAIGLGYDSVINDYKIVVILNLEEQVEEEEEEAYFVKAMVYNLGTNSWREIDNGPVSGSKYLECYGTLFNGTLHWNSCHGNNKMALTFDITTEVFSSLEIPRVELEKVYRKHFMVLNGSLAVFIGEITSGDVFLSIWVMHIYGDAESWTRQLVIGPLTTVIIRPFFRWKNGVLFVQNVYSQLISISLGTNELTLLNTQGVIVNAIVYQESLMSIK